MYIFPLSVRSLLVEMQDGYRKETNLASEVTEYISKHSRPTVYFDDENSDLYRQFFSLASLARNI